MSKRHSIRTRGFAALMATALFAAVALPTVPASANPLPAPPTLNRTAAGQPASNLDLSSSQQVSGVIPGIGSGSVVINSGGASRSVDNNSLLTPAERVAAWQVLSSGGQSLQLGANGNAIGGNFSINQTYGANASVLVIPQGVTSFNRSSTLNVIGDLTNFGFFSILNSGTASATITASNIFNHGVMTSVVPLNLVATGSIVNSGTLHSSDVLNMIAGSAIVNGASAFKANATIVAEKNLAIIAPSVVNTGLIQSTNGNINISSLVASSITVANSTGVLSALNGDINVRESGFTGKHNFSLIGGDALSNSFNIWSGDGHVKIDAGNVSGAINVNAGAINVMTTSDVLKIGESNLTGDPTWYNNGDIQITGNITTQQQFDQIAIIATGDVTSASGSSIVTFNSGVNNLWGGSTLIMAGTQFTTNGTSAAPNTNSAAGDSTSNIVVTGASPTGGSINLSNMTQLNTSSVNGWGGNVTLVAFAGSNPSSGAINMNTPIDTTGGTNLPSGNVLAIAGAKSGTGITSGAITTSNGANCCAGNIAGQVLLATATPVILSASQPHILNGVALPNSSIGIGPIQNASVNVLGSISTNSAPLTIVAGRDVIFGSTTAAQTNAINIATNGSLFPSAYPVAGYVCIFAGGNIATTVTSGTQPFLNISTTPSTADLGYYAGPIMMLAGTSATSTINVTLDTGPTAGNNAENPQQIAGNLTITGASPTGGSVLLGTAGAGLQSMTTAANAGSVNEAGGDIVLVALAGGSAGSGKVVIPGVASPITTGATGGGGAQYPATSGNVTILAGAPSGTSINIGSDIDTAVLSGASYGGGSVNIRTAGLAATSSSTQGLPYSIAFNYPAPTPVDPPLSQPFLTTTGALTPGTLLPASIVIGGTITATGGAEIGSIEPSANHQITDITVAAGGNLDINSVSNQNNTLYNPGQFALPTSSINLSSGGTMKFASGASITSNAAAASATGVSGGVINIKAASFSFALLNSQVIVSAVGTGGYSIGDNTGGNGGTISITTTATPSGSVNPTINIGNAFGAPTAPGNFSISATGDLAGGDGGKLYITSSGNINVDTSQLALNPAAGANTSPAIGGGVLPTGTGATIVLDASKNTSTTGAAGLVFVNGTLDASGAASQYDASTGTGNPGGNGGSITILTNSSTTFNVGAATTNGTGGNGVLSANGNTTDTGTQAFGSGGSITVKNLGGAIKIAANGIQVQAANGAGTYGTGTSYPGGTGGRIVLNAATTLLSLGGLDASGGAYGTSGTEASGSGGSIDITTNSTTAFMVNSATPGSVTNGVNGTITAKGNNGTAPAAAASIELAASATSYGDGGSIQISNLKGGINVAATSLSVAAGDANSFINRFGGDGGKIVLYAPKGPVFSASSLDASGGGGILFNITGVTVAGSVITLPAGTSGFQFPLGLGVLFYNDANVSNFSGPFGVTTGATSNSITVVGSPGTFATTDMQAYYQAGNGGSISITSKGTGTNKFVVTGTVAGQTQPSNGTNGVNGNLTAAGFNGGSISLTELGTAGIAVGTDGVTVQSTTPGNPDGLNMMGNMNSVVYAPLLGQGGSGGTISLQAPAGPVAVLGNLSVNAIGSYLTFSNGTQSIGPGVAGAGGSIYILTKSTSPFTLGTGTAVTNGVQGVSVIGAQTGTPANTYTYISSLSANGGLGVTQGGDGGSIIVINNGTGGVSMGTATNGCYQCVTVNTPDSNQVTFGNIVPADGGSISIQSPAGPFKAFQLAPPTNAPNVSLLSANGGAGSTPFASGLAGSIILIANNDSTALPLTIQAYTGGTQDVPEFSATGWNGGSVTVISMGTKGLKIASVPSNTAPIAVTAAAANVNATAGNTANRTFGGPGGNISLQALNGPVSLLTAISANGGAGAGSVYATGGTVTQNSGLGQDAIIQFPTANITGTFNPSVPILITGVSGGNIYQQEYQVVNAATVNGGDTDISMGSLFYANGGPNPYTAGTVTIGGIFAGGSGGQISIVTNQATGFDLGSGGSLAANAGTSGLNGGIISITNLGSGGIKLATPSNLSVAPGNASTAFPGGKGGTINLTAFNQNAFGGTGGPVYIGGNLSVNGGTAGVAANGEYTGSGAGGTIAITYFSGTLFNLGGATAPCTTGCNGVAGILSATGSGGGSISIENMSTAGSMTFTSSSVNLTATLPTMFSTIAVKELVGCPNCGNGGNIDFTIGANTTLTGSGTLSVDAAPGSLGRGGFITLNAGTLASSSNMLLSASGSQNQGGAIGSSGTGGLISVTQSKSGATALSVGSGGLVNFDVNGTKGQSLGGTISINSNNGITVNGALSTCQSCATLSGTINLAVKTTTSTTAISVPNADTIQTATLNITNSSFTPITINNANVGAVSVTANGGAVFFTNTANLTILSSSQATPDFGVHNGSLTFGAPNIVVSGPIVSSGQVNLKAASSNGTVSLLSRVTGYGVAISGYAVTGSPDGLVSSLNANGIALNVQDGGITDLTTATGILNLVVAGDSTATTVSIVNTGNVSLNMGASKGIVNFSLTNAKGSIITTTDLTANNIVLDTQSMNSPADSYSISLIGSVGTTSTSVGSTSVVIKATGTINTGAPKFSIAANSISLSSNNGNIGNSDAGALTPGDYTAHVNLVNVNSTLGTINVFTGNAGQAYITNDGSTSAVIANAQTGGDFKFVTTQGFTVNPGQAGGDAINSTFGSVTLVNSGTSSSGTVLINGNITASGGPVIIENDSTGSPQINVGNNVILSGVARSFIDQVAPSIAALGQVGVALTNSPLTLAPVIGNFSATNPNVTINGQGFTSTANPYPQTGATAYFGTNGISANGANINIDTSTPATGPNVIFNGSSGAITLGTGSTINAGTSQSTSGVVNSILSLDLTNTAQATRLKNLQGTLGIGGTLVVAGGATGNITFPNTISFANLTALRVPVGATVQFTSFGVNNPVAVTVQSKATNGVTINGTLQFAGAGSSGNIYINSNGGQTQSANVLNTGKLTSDNDLSLSAAGRVTLQSAISKLSAGVNAPYGSLLVTTGSVVYLTSVPAVTTPPAGTINLLGAVSSGTLGSVIMHSTGSVLLPSGGTLTGQFIELQIGGTNGDGKSSIIAGNSSVASPVAITAGALSIITGSGSAGAANTGLKGRIVNLPILTNSSGSTNYGAGSLTFNMLSAGLNIGQSKSMAISGSNLDSSVTAKLINPISPAGTSTLLFDGPVSVGSLVVSSPVVEINAGTSVGATDSRGTVSMTAASVTGSSSSIAALAGVLFSPFTSGGNLSLRGVDVSTTSGSITIGPNVGAFSVDGSSFSAGTLSATYVPGAGALRPFDITTSGSVFLDAKSISMTDINAITSIGGNITLYARSGAIALGGLFEADGGNIVVTASGNVTGAPTMLAQAIGTSSNNSTGGGIEIGAGITNQSFLSRAYDSPAGTTPAFPLFMQPDGTYQPLGSYTFLSNIAGQNTATGVVVLNTNTFTGTGDAVNLSLKGTNPALLNLNGGAIVLDAAGVGQVNLDGGNFSVNGYQAIAYTAPSSVNSFDVMVEKTEKQDEYLVADVFTTDTGRAMSLTSGGLRSQAVTPRRLITTGAKANISVSMNSGCALIRALRNLTLITPFGDVNLRKGAVASVNVDAHGLRVIGCTGSGDAEIKAGGHSIPVLIGQEVFVSRHQLTQHEQMNADGIGRRRFTTQQVGNGLHAGVCEVSLIGLMSSGKHTTALRYPQTAAERKLAADLLKNAAVLDVVTRGHGAYQAVPASKEHNDESVFRPVSFAR